MDKHDIQLLFEYNRWANARILNAAAKITEAQYLASGNFSYGDLRETFVHILFAEWLWRMRWQGTTPDFQHGLQPENFPTVAALQTRWTEEEKLLMEFVATLTDEKLNTELDYTSTEGGRHRRLLWETMAHVVNHGTQHRSEAAAMLTQMGHSPGDIDLTVFLNEVPRQGL